MFEGSRKKERELKLKLKSENVYSEDSKATTKLEGSSVSSYLPVSFSNLFVTISININGIYFNKTGGQICC